MNVKEKLHIYYIINIYNKQQNITTEIKSNQIDFIENKITQKQ